MRRRTGKGPTRARTYFAGRDIVFVVLAGGYLRAEQTLSDAGMDATVDAARRALQEALEEEFRSAVEGLVGRRVVDFVSANKTGSELTIEIFFLEPEPAA